ncbi:MULTISPECIES: integration host factor subunit alpha [Actinobacillus]|uniref:Integration host factor subunit alpha n=3 Tax=Actinobacillus TaxID=713 RepID=C5S1Z6_9PAST|nr:MULTISPECIES: integration host factor subunit alpha [Actinobacillus]AWI51526.1 integration host factor subunit alpha [Actinobacillus porcitonsillarum]EEF16126.1 integration host factor, alpha chain [Actinobacillus minor 202]EER47099.1 integration host factor subunit alpha [Actinobacillus minor NM305]MDD6910981.1 integration host factor subunit alpha [Actinobacillus minor]MDY4714162.1 integration host factor subunit alpha [Actinobacillus minor]
MALTKIELAEALVEKCGFEKRTAKLFIDQFFEEIKRALTTGEEVKLSGFGNFSVREKNARPGRNPKTGESVAVSARRVVVFKAGQKMRDRVEHAKVKK